TEGMWLDDERLAGRQANSLVAGQALLDDPRTEAAVIVMSPADVSRFGLPADQLSALVLDEAGMMSTEDRGTLTNALELALPHSLMTVALKPDPELLESRPVRRHADDGLWHVESDDLQRVCERLLATLLSRRAT